MSARSVRQLLEKIRIISEANSGGEDAASEDEQSDSQSDFTGNEESQHEYVFDDDENVSSVRRGQRHQRVLSDSESDNEQSVEESVRARDGTVWYRMKQGPTIGRPSFTFKEVSGATAYAK
ncbi:hypothetical protein WN48_01697 [Eufriesea mexicana]|uniref:Uncharacterized protein n=1 Tax=Eufriesea mexicana TaxID=516756 RepID=A0A310SFU3_9HYME|nr:hypothetical protein WN48_01697 [Eufriesea mexicana]